MISLLLSLCIMGLRQNWGLAIADNLLSLTGKYGKQNAVVYLSNFCVCCRLPQYR